MGGTVRLGRRVGLAVVALLSWEAGAPRAAEPRPVAADADLAARAGRMRALPCAGDAAVDGFEPAVGVPPLWRVAGALVSVRRAGDERVAFVLSPSSSGTCAVRQVVVLPARGEVLACALPDGSSQGVGIHAKLPSGRRDVVFWQGDGAGGLRRVDLDRAGIETDTGHLICALPDTAP